MVFGQLTNRDSLRAFVFLSNNFELSAEEIAYCLVAIVGSSLKIERSTYELKIDEVKFYRVWAYRY